MPIEQSDEFFEDKTCFIQFLSIAFINIDALDEVEDGDSVADGTEQCVAVGGEQHVALLVYRPAEIGELRHACSLSFDKFIHCVSPHLVAELHRSTRAIRSWLVRKKLC